jgi:hypothetical protein
MEGRRAVSDLILVMKGVEKKKKKMEKKLVVKIEALIFALRF